MSKEIVYKKDVLDLLSMMPPEEGITRALLMQSVKQLPSAEPVIPLSWIEAQIEWLKSLDNAFSTLTAVQISAMVNKWKDEQDDGCSQVFEREESDV